jgi:phage terminase large subunit-like protein
MEGNLIRRDWFRFYDELPQAVPAGWIAQSLDIALIAGEANDFSVCTTWRMIRGDYYLVDVFRDRLQYPDLRRKIASLAVQHGAQTILNENAGPGLTLLQDLHHTPPPGMPHPIGQKPNGSKADRVVAQSAKSGDYEAALRVQYAIAHARFLQGNRDGLEPELRHLVRSSAQVEANRQRFDHRNLHVVYGLLLTVLAQKPSSAETFLEGLAIAGRPASPSDSVVNRYHALAGGEPIGWRSVNAVDLLQASALFDADSTVLLLESGTASLVLFALRGGPGELDRRCHVELASPALVNALTGLLATAIEENDRITGQQKVYFKLPRCRGPLGGAWTDCQQ